MTEAPRYAISLLNFEVGFCNLNKGTRYLILAKGGIPDLRNKILTCLTAAFVLLSVLSLEEKCLALNSTPLTTEEKSVLQLANNLRGKYSLPKLQVDSLLNQVAKAHSQDMAARKIPDSGPPEYETPFQRARKKRLTDLGNVVVVAKGNSLEDLQAFLQTDQAALQNLLSPQLTHIGIGIVPAQDNTIWLTIHMVERVITFSEFKLKRLSGVVPRRFISINGVVPAEKKAKAPPAPAAAPADAPKEKKAPAAKKEKAPAKEKKAPAPKKEKAAPKEKKAPAAKKKKAAEVPVEITVS